MCAQPVARPGKDEGIPPRERILAAAAELFYRHGVRAVGVDAIAEAAGTNKMTLYRHFPSKDELVAEYLRQEAHKAERARGLLAERDLALSVQVLQEFYVQATRASRLDPLSHEQAGRLIESFFRFPVGDVTTQVMRAALHTRDRFQISYWDAAVLESARALGCDVVLSEDMGDGQDYAGVTVLNPFRTS